MEVYPPGGSPTQPAQASSGTDRDAGADVDVYQQYTASVDVAGGDHGDGGARGAQDERGATLAVAPTQRKRMLPPAFSDTQAQTAVFSLDVEVIASGMHPDDAAGGSVTITGEVPIEVDPSEVRLCLPWAPTGPVTPTRVGAAVNRCRFAHCTQTAYPEELELVRRQLPAPPFVPYPASPRAWSRDVTVQGVDVVCPPVPHRCVTHVARAFPFVRKIMACCSACRGPHELRRLCDLGNGP